MPRNASTSSGIATITSHAPSANFVQITITRHQPGRRGADAVDRDAVTPARLARAQPVAHHPGLRERERGEDADHVQVDQRVDARVVGPRAARTRCSGQHDDPVREDEPVAEVGELPREEPVAREQRREAREALVGRVRGEHEHGERQHLDDPVHEADATCRPGRRRARSRESTDGVPVASAARASAPRATRRRRTSRSRSCRERRASSPRSSVRPPERVDAVRDRLDTGQRGRAGGERAQDDEKRHRARPVAADAGRRPAGSPRRALGQPDADQRRRSRPRTRRSGARTGCPASLTPRRFATAISTTHASDSVSS